jgi:hypothetical protein
VQHGYTKILSVSELATVFIHENVRSSPQIGCFQLRGISFHFSAQCAQALPQSSRTSATAFIVAKMIWAHLKQALLTILRNANSFTRLPAARTS